MKKLNKNLIVVLHNIFKTSRSIEFMKLCATFGVQTVILSKVNGSAAITAVPEAQKEAIRAGINMFFLPDLPDVIELFRPDKIYIAIEKEFAEREFNAEEIMNYLEEGKKILLIFGGHDPGLTRKDLELGETVHPPGLEQAIDTIPLATIILYEIHLKSK